MIVFLNIVYIIVIVYFCCKFIRLLTKLKKDKIFPITNADLIGIRTYPQKVVGLPTISKQKIEIFLYVFILLFVIGMYIIDVVYKKFDASFYLLVLFPLYYSHNLLNLFAIINDGVLSGSRFVRWKKIKSFQFVPINLNHRYYGYSKEVNDGYEMIMQEKFSTIRCIVTTDEAKEKLTKILCDHGLEETGVKGDEQCQIIGRDQK
ncbi:hypothetical protein ACIQ4I_08680 [Rummeliibacillus sp. NPDC094406]|uniref:hypothetical protein n=1 Tax=Rummeliibacillus sp. NPDC094406 TaxID=3364511 RepID=UPI00380E4432